MALNDEAKDGFPFDLFSYLQATTHQVNILDPLRCNRMLIATVFVLKFTGLSGMLVCYRIWKYVGGALSTFTSGVAMKITVIVTIAILLQQSLGQGT